MPFLCQGDGVWGWGWGWVVTAGNATILVLENKTEKQSNRWKNTATLATQFPIFNQTCFSIHSKRKCLSKITL